MNKLISGFCFLFNLVFAVNAVVNGSYFIAMICFIFAAFCLNNYHKH